MKNFINHSNMDYKGTANRILDEVRKTPGCRLEDVVRTCSELTWNQVFHAVDRLSRTGQLCLRREGSMAYSLWLQERLSPSHDETGEPSLRGCGQVIDRSGILAHRQRRPEPDREAESKAERKQARVLSRKRSVAKVG